MDFFCPVCQKSYELTPEQTITTAMHQTAYICHCPICNQELVVYGGTSSEQTTVHEKN